MNYLNLQKIKKLNKNIIVKGIRLLMLFFVFIQLVGCKPTRWIEKGDYLLQKNTIEIDNKSIGKKELESFYRQEPNRRFLLLFKVHLAAYNFSKFGKDRKWKSWIQRVIGEEPAVFDSVLVERTKNQFEKYLKNEAFYNAEVEYKLSRKRKRAWVNYYIETGEPILIKDINYQIEDSTLVDMVFSDTANSFLENSSRMTIKSLEAERNRIVTQLRDSGYFEFNPEYIRYKIDTLFNVAHITLILSEVLKQDSLLNITEHPHKKFWINEVFFLPDFDSQKAIRNKGSYFQTFDTTYQNGYGFVFPGKPNIRPKVILKANTIKQGDQYNFTKVNSTSRYLNSLKLFRLSNFNFYREPNNDSLINCMVQLTPSVYQNYSVNFETTKNDANIGVGGNVNYQHKNLFRGAEILNIKISGSFQRQIETPETEAFNIYEYGTEASLETPSFILPLKLDRFYKKFNPKTSFSISYNYKENPYFIRTFSNGNMGYNWKGNKSIRHFVSPIDIGYVYVTILSQEYYNEFIKGKYLENNFRDYLIAGANYSMFYQNKAKKAFRSFHYFRWNVGTAGNLLHFTHDKLGLKQKEDDGYYSMIDLQ
nr:hypothetical protein [Salinivirgaceae bacterium]